MNWNPCASHSSRKSSRNSTNYRFTESEEYPDEKSIDWPSILVTMPRKFPLPSLTEGKNFQALSFDSHENRTRTEIFLRIDDKCV